MVNRLSNDSCLNKAVLSQTRCGAVGRTRGCRLTLLKKPRRENTITVYEDVEFRSQNKQRKQICEFNILKWARIVLEPGTDTRSVLRSSIACRVLKKHRRHTAGTFRKRMESLALDKYFSCEPCRRIDTLAVSWYSPCETLHIIMLHDHCYAS